METFVSELIYPLLLFLSQKSRVTLAKPDYGVIYVAKCYPEWQRLILLKLEELYNEEQNCLPPNKEILTKLKTIEYLKPHMKKLMHFVQHTKVNGY